MAPGAVTHEGHQDLSLASRVVTSMLVPSIGVTARCERFESCAVAPGAVMPVQFHSAMTSRALCGKIRFVESKMKLATAPGTSRHRFGHRPTAAAARMAHLQQTAELTLEFLVPNTLPVGSLRRPPIGSVFHTTVACPRHFDSLVSGQHLARIVIAFAGVQFQ